MITAQLPVAQWHDMIGEPTIADAILDRIIHNSHRIALEGDSMRRKKRRAPGPNSKTTKRIPINFYNQATKASAATLSAI